MDNSFRSSIDAILFACTGWFLFCLCDAISKTLITRYSVFEILAIGSTIGAVLSALWILRYHGLAGFSTPKLKWYMARGLMQTISSACSIKALLTLPLADFYGVIFLIPMVTTLFATLFLKESIGLHRIVAIGVGFMGVLVITGPSFSEPNPGYLFALGSVAASSMTAIFIRKIGRETIPARFTFYPLAVSSLIYLPLASFTGFTMPQSLGDLSMLIVFAPLSLAGILCYSTGFSRARETAVVAPFHYTQMIWGAILGFTLFGDVPEMTTVIGSAIITGAGGMIIWRERVHHVQIATTASETPL